MELPEELKTLYLHWEKYTASKEEKLHPENIFQNVALYKDVSDFIRERMSIWEKKYSKQNEPFTADPILSKYRFCNIFREFDKQTIEFHTLLNPLRNDLPLWLLNMFYCRMVARPQTIKDVGVLSFAAEENKKLYARLFTYPRPRYGTPYVFPVSVIMRSSTPTRELFITQYVPSVIQKVAAEIETWNAMSVAEGVEKVLPLFGFNLRFLWTEVLIDVAYQYPEHIHLRKEFPVGPGSTPTFKRINSHTEPSLLAAQLAELQFDPGITFNGTPVVLSAENWEGVGCEFRKYTNLQAGKGRKRLYR